MSKNHLENHLSLVKKTIKRRSKPKEKYRPSQRSNTGKTSRLPYNIWLARVFDLNEDVPQQEKLTDDDIINSLASEFTRKLATVRAILTSPGKIGSERTRYMRRYKPPMISLRYNEVGIPFIGPGIQILTLNEIRKRCFHYNVVDPRFFTRDEIEWVKNQRDQYIPSPTEPNIYKDFRFPSEELIEKHPYGSLSLGRLDSTLLAINEIEMEYVWSLSQQ